MGSAYPFATDPEERTISSTEKIHGSTNGKLISEKEIQVRMLH